MVSDLQTMQVLLNIKAAADTHVHTHMFVMSFSLVHFTVGGEQYSKLIPSYSESPGTPTSPSHMLVLWRQISGDRCCPES